MPVKRVATNAQEEYVNCILLRVLDEIIEANGSHAKLTLLLSKKRELAAIYAEDGALETANCIETIEIPMVQSFLKLCSA